MLHRLYAGQEVACASQSAGRHSSALVRCHRTGLVGSHLIDLPRQPGKASELSPSPPAELLRPLAEYEAVLKSGW